MNIQKIIDKIETRKKNTKAFQDELQKVFDFLTGLNIDVNIHSDNIRARYRMYLNSGNLCERDTIRDDTYEFVIAIRNGEACLFDAIDINLMESVGICYINYFNIPDVKNALFSILTQLEHMSDRQKDLDEIKKLTKNI